MSLYISQKFRSFSLLKGATFLILRKTHSIDVEVFFRCAAGLRYHLQEDADDVDYLVGN
jgi:hypothetical protein